MKRRPISFSDFSKEPERKYINGYDDGEKIILQYREGKEKIELEISGFPYYFCIHQNDYVSSQKVLKDMIKTKKIKDLDRDGDFIKIYVRCSGKYDAYDERREAIVLLDKAGIQHYEADLKPYQRLLIDEHLIISDEYRVLYFDIETDDRGKGIVIGRDRILSIAACNAEGKVYYYTGDERTILKKFLDRCEDYDIIAGWNSEKFDLPYIRERMRYNNLYSNMKWILHIDMMQKTMEMNKRNKKLIRAVRGFSLNAIAEYFLGEKKVEHEMGIYEMFEKDPELLKKYNIQDVVLLKKIDSKLNLIKQKIVEHNITGCFLNEFAVSRILDFYVLRHAQSFGHVRFRTKPYRDETSFEDRESGYTGGYVLEPIKGIHENIYHFDFTSLYPSIIQTFNISPETVREGEGDFIFTPNGQTFARETGIIPKIIGDLLQARNDIRYNEMKNVKEGTQEYELLYFKQYAFKTISNSFYGILGASFTRYYRRENAEAITKSGHYLIKLVKKYFEKRGMTVLYGDTDSVFVRSETNIDPDEFHKQINQFISYHLFKRFRVIDSKIDLKVEAHYPKILIVMKKKYIKVENGELLVVGMESERRETLEFTREKQKELFRKLLLEGCSREEISKWIDSLKSYVLCSMTKDELMLQVKLSKDVELYDKKIKDESGNVIGVKESKLPHVQVAKTLMERGFKENGMNAYEKGCYIKFIVLEHKPKVKAISYYDFDGTYDGSYYWNVKVFAPLQRVLETVYPETDWSKLLIEIPRQRRQSKKQQSLGI